MLSNMILSGKRSLAGTSQNEIYALVSLGGFGSPQMRFIQSEREWQQDLYRQNGELTNPRIFTVEPHVYIFSIYINLWSIQSQPSNELGLEVTEGVVFWAMGMYYTCSELFW